MAKYQVMVFSPQGALKDAANLDTSKPEECLSVVKMIFASGGNIAEQMAQIPKADKERLFNYLNDEQAYPSERYTRRIEEIHEALGLDLA